MKIDEKTLIPISLLSMIVIVVFYAAIVWSKVNEHDEAIKEQKLDTKTIIQDLNLIKIQLGITEKHSK